MELLGGVVPNLYVALKMEPSADRSINMVVGGGRGGCRNASTVFHVRKHVTLTTLAHYFK